MTMTISNAATPEDLRKFKAQKPRNARKGPMPESALQSEIEMRLRALYGPRCLFGRNNSRVIRLGKALVRFGLGKGSSDVILCLDGRFVAIECKTKGVATKNSGKYRHLDEQVAYVESVRAAGGLAGFADSWPDVADIINGGSGGEPH
jgi:hypothetical protein